MHGTSSMPLGYRDNYSVIVDGSDDAIFWVYIGVH